MSKTTILIEKNTRESLKSIGSKAESYDSIINSLLKLKNQTTTGGS